MAKEIDFDRNLFGDKQWTAKEPIGWQLCPLCRVSHQFN